MLKDKAETRYIVDNKSQQHITVTVCSHSSLYLVLTQSDVTHKNYRVSSCSVPVMWLFDVSFSLTNNDMIRY